MKAKLRFIFGMMLLIGSVASVKSYAETTPTAPAAPVVAQSGNGASVAVQEESLWKKLSLNYWGNFSGPSLSPKVSSAYTPDSSGMASQAINLDGVVTAGYRPSTTTFIGIGLPVNYEPVMGQKLALNNVFIRASKAKVIDAGPLGLTLGARVSLPTHEASRAKGFLTAIRLEQNMTFDVPHTKLQLGTFTFLRGTLNSSPGGNALSFYAAPYASYPMTDALAATLWCDLVQLQMSQRDGLAGLSSAPVSMQAGVNWDIGTRLSLNPYVNVYPGGLSLESSSVGMIVSAKAL